MRILLIGNFAPPYEEENLGNLSLLYRLEKDGHECTVINISPNPSGDRRIIDTTGFPGFLMKLLRHGLRKDVFHFSTKGYLRVGLLKMMASIFFGSIFGVRTVVEFHSELFSLLGQMRSPFGGTQTLHTSFFLANSIIFSDRDTYDVASMYVKKPNFRLIPTAVHIPEEIRNDGSAAAEKIKRQNKLIVFSNVQFPSFVFDILNEYISRYPLPPDTGIAISLSEKPTSKLRHVIEEIGRDITDSIIFIEPNDLKSSLLAYMKADIVLRPLSCDGETFFESFTLSVRKTLRSKENVYFPGSLVLIKEGRTADMCVRIINTMLEAGPADDADVPDKGFYESFMDVYTGK